MAERDLAMPRLSPANDEPVGFQYPKELDVVTKPSRVHRLIVTATVCNPNILSTANEPCVSPSLKRLIIVQVNRLQRADCDVAELAVNTHPTWRGSRHW